MHWISVSHEAGIALILADRAIVVDLQKGAVVKTCPLLDGPPNSSRTNQWLLNTPSYGPVLAVDYLSPEQRTNTLLGWRADPSWSCGKSSVRLDPSELSHIVASGKFGVGDIGFGDGIGIGVELDADGALTGHLAGRFPYGYRVPRDKIGELKPQHVGISINNPEILVLGLAEGTHRHVLVLRKKDETWHDVPLPPQLATNPGAVLPMPPIRAFGHFIAVTEVQPRDGQGRESAGGAEWRTTASRMGPDVAYLLKEFKGAYPGMLHLYDVETGRKYIISTRQGDSEILLVQDKIVYYRASDRLYSATITSDGIGPARLIATSEVVRDVHWAFKR
jgi:hypothetical protein